jgi:hypothetical protein
MSQDISINTPVAPVAPTVELSWGSFQSAVKAALPFARKNPERPEARVLLRARSRGEQRSLIVVATDGHRLIRVTLPLFCAAEFSILVTVASLKQFVKVVPLGDMAVCTLDGEGHVTFPSGSIQLAAAPESEDLVFPPFEAIIPELRVAEDKEQRTVEPVGINPGYLAEIANAAKILGVNLGMQVGAPLDPIRFDGYHSGSLDVLFIQMPMRI